MYGCIGRTDVKARVGLDDEQNTEQEEGDRPGNEDGQGGRMSGGGVN